MGHSKAACCETKKFTTALKLQIILLSLLVTCAAALFCLPAKNAYADEIEIDGVTYEYTTTSVEGQAWITKISTSKSTVVVPEKINGLYVYVIDLYDGVNTALSSNVTSLDVSRCSELFELECNAAYLDTL